MARISAFSSRRHDFGAEAQAERVVSAVFPIVGVIVRRVQNIYGASDVIEYLALQPPLHLVRQPVRRKRHKTGEAVRRLVERRAAALLYCRELRKALPDVLVKFRLSGRRFAAAASQETESKSGAYRPKALFVGGIVLHFLISEDDRVICGVEKLRHAADAGLLSQRMDYAAALLDRRLRR